MGLFRRSKLRTIPAGQTAAGDELVAMPASDIEAFWTDVLSEVGGRYGDALPETVAGLLRVGIFYVTGREADTFNDDTIILAHTMARFGYFSRVVETERLTAALEIRPELSALLHERHADTGEYWPGTVVEFCAANASSEPLNPRPDHPGALSWLIPGLGGQIRSDMARRSVEAMLSDDGTGRPRSVADATPDEFVRVWKYGFFLRYCEDELPAGTLAES